MEEITPVKKKNFKKIAIIALIVIALLGGLIAGINAYRTMVRRVDSAINHIMEDRSSNLDLDDYWTGSYYSYKDTKYFSKTLSAYFTALAEDSSLSPSTISNAVLNLEKLEYFDENTKSAIDGLYATIKPRMLERNPINFISSLSPISDTEYYSNAETILPADEIIALYADTKTEALNSNNLEDLVNYLSDVQAITAAYPVIKTELLISSDEILDKVTPLTTPTIFTDGAGGYYDYSDRKSYTQYKDSLHYTHTTGYQYYGDFVVINSSKRALRTTDGKQWEEDLLKKYDSSSTSICYKGETLKVASDPFITLINGGTTITKPTSGNTSGEVPAADFTWNTNPDNLLSVLISTEDDREILCFVKSDGIAFLQPRVVEVSFDSVSTQGYDLTVGQAQHFTVPVITKENTTTNDSSASFGVALTGFPTTQTYKDMEAIVLEAFANFDPSVLYDSDNQRMIMVVTAPEDTAELIATNADNVAWASFRETVLMMTDTGKQLIAGENYSDSFAAVVVNAANKNEILFAAMDGKTATAEFGPVPTN